MSVVMLLLRPVPSDDVDFTWTVVEEEEEEAAVDACVLSVLACSLKLCLSASRNS